MAMVRRSAALLPALLLAGCACLLLSLVPGIAESLSFLSARPVDSARGLAAPRPRGRTAMQSFKEDFDAWRSALTPEERKQVQTQAQSEFNKKFRKSADFQKDIPQEKVKAFGKILSKFFDSESADYKKDLEAKTPNYNGLLDKAGDKVMDFSLRNRVVEVDRDADRRYHFATMKIREAQAKGEMFPQSSPLQEIWAIQNNDTASHEKALQVVEFIKKAAADPSCPKSCKAYMDQWATQGIPKMGENFELLLPQVLVNQLLYMAQNLQGALAEYGQNKTEAELELYVKEVVPEIGAQVIKDMTDKYVAARDDVERSKDIMKDFFRSQRDMPGKTKADILREIWAELPKVTDKPVPPLDDEMLAELAQVPAIIPGEFKHSWGTADKLYKSEAIDAFGMKYLLGVFETKDAAVKAFTDWNAEYDKARADMKDEMQQWSKQENARLEKDPTGRDRIAKVLEEARSA